MKLVISFEVGKYFIDFNIYLTSILFVTILKQCEQSQNGDFYKSLPNISKIIHEGDKGKKCSKISQHGLRMVPF